MVITNGYNVYPRNVEEAIYQHPNVEECIVAGIPDKSRGEIVKAWIKCKEGRELSTDDSSLRDNFFDIGMLFKTVLKRTSFSHGNSASIRIPE